MAQRQRICLLAAGCGFNSPVREDPTCGATKPVHHNHCTCALEPGAVTTEAQRPRATTPQQGKPLPKRSRAQQPESSPPRRSTGSPRSSEDPAQPQTVNKIILKDALSFIPWITLSLNLTYKERKGPEGPGTCLNPFSYSLSKTKNLKNPNYHTIQQSHFWTFIQRKRKLHVKKIFACLCSHEHYPQ